MKQLTFYFDPVSPYAYLAFERLPQVLQGRSYAVRYQPILFAGLLKHHGQLGPAEISPKRAWTYRQVQWLACRLEVPLQMPAGHPFNPLPLLRLALACAPAGGTPNRQVCESVLHHVWRGGASAEDPARLAELTTRLSPLRDPGGEEVKQALRLATEEAVQRGLFGVPTIELDGHLFWGLDALDMVAACLDGDPWIGGADWNAASGWPQAARRPGSQA
jgi:2-hydroxychromene-2-carboxylate isomerase